MSWLTAAWSMCASAAILLALMHLAMWVKNRHAAVYLLFAAMALSAAGNAFIELQLLQTHSIDIYRRLLHWEHVFVFGLLVSMIWLVYLHLGTARRWLAVVITVLWCVALGISLASPNSLVFGDTIQLEQITALWGETFTIAQGSVNPWKYLADTTSLIILIYVADAAFTAARRGLRRRALLIGGSILFFMITAGIHTPLVDAGILAMPYMISFAFLAIVVAMSYDLVSEAVKAAGYAQRLDVEEARWNTIINNVHLVVLNVDPQHRVTYSNPFFQRISGYSIKDLKTLPIPDLLPDLEDGMVEPADDAWFHQCELVCASGETRTLALSSVPVSTVEGAVSGRLYIGADITTERLAQEELTRSHREMQRLGRANMLGELSTALAHELNQPLAAILANSQAARRILARQPPDLEEINEILDDIVRDDKRAGAVIQHLRAMLGHEDMTPTRFSMVDAVREVLTMLRGELDANGATLSLRCQEAMPDVDGGRIEIQHVVINLILNATHAVTESPTDRCQITLDLTHDETHLKVAVRDTGPGFPAEQAQTMFDAFSTTKRGGLGMGLTICRRIVEAHGGRIHGENHPDGGALFSFSLPRPTTTGG